jgi:ABC-type phosphate/phosphonate transport system substrate-binding protein
LALRLVLAPYPPVLSRVVETGSHAASMAAVRNGDADVCAIDCVSFALARRHRPELTDALRCIARSPPMPALPYVTAAGRHPGQLVAMRAALHAALLDPALAEARGRLLLAGAELTGGEAYAAVAEADASAPDLRLAQRRSGRDRSAQHG